jgi:hypothetical protein
MAKKTTGKRHEERGEIAQGLEEALNPPAEEVSGMVSERAAEKPASAESLRQHAGAGPSEVPEGPEAGPQGAEAAAGTGEEGAGFIPSVGGLIHQGIYSGFYYLSFGVVFGALAVGHLIPSDTAIAEGVRDGADAARHALEGKLRSETGEGPMAGTA